MGGKVKDLEAMERDASPEMEPSDALFVARLGLVLPSIPGSRGCFPDMNVRATL